MPEKSATAITRHLFIADLHLRPSPGSEIALEQFLEGYGAGCALYVLGDLFDLWLGDDLDLPRYTAVTQVLRGFQARGGAAHVMVGNHDFLVGQNFFTATGARPLPDPTVLALDGQRWVLTHGDTLCTADVDYQALRARIRHPDHVREFLALPAARRVQVAHELERASDRATAEKSPTQMNAAPHAVRQVLAEHRAQVLLHGHTHRPGVEILPAPVNAIRITLGSWGACPNACLWEAGSYRLIGFPELDPQN